jgi:hypothetical protein
MFDSRRDRKLRSVASGGGAGKVPEKHFVPQYSRRTMPLSCHSKAQESLALPVGKAFFEQNKPPDHISERARWMFWEFQLLPLAWCELNRSLYRTESDSMPIPQQLARPNLRVAHIGSAIEMHCANALARTISATQSLRSRPDRTAGPADPKLRLSCASRQNRVAAKASSPTSGDSPNIACAIKCAVTGASRIPSR